MRISENERMIECDDERIRDSEIERMRESEHYLKRDHNLRRCRQGTKLKTELPRATAVPFLRIWIAYVSEYDHPHIVCIVHYADPY